jgi:hypothetical protein
MKSRQRHDFGGSHRAGAGYANSSAYFVLFTCRSPAAPFFPSTNALATSV